MSVGRYRRWACVAMRGRRVRGARIVDAAEDGPHGRAELLADALPGDPGARPVANGLAAVGGVGFRPDDYHPRSRESGESAQPACREVGLIDDQEVRAHPCHTCGEYFPGFCGDPAVVLPGKQIGGQMAHPSVADGHEDPRGPVADGTARRVIHGSVRAWRTSSLTSLRPLVAAHIRRHYGAGLRSGTDTLPKERFAASATQLRTGPQKGSVAGADAQSTEAAHDRTKEQPQRRSSP